MFIGAGGAIGPRAFHMHDPQMEIDVVDIDPKVLQMAREHFFLEDDPHIRTIAQDGRMFLSARDSQPTIAWSWTPSRSAGGFPFTW